MNLRIFITCVSIMLLFLHACGQPAGKPAAASQHDSAATTGAQPGKLIPSLPLQSHASQSYALYLPSHYNGNTRLPLFVFFDPQGEGYKPVEQYSRLAEQYGCILAGSNSARNGLSLPELQNIGSNLLQEMIARFAIDTGKIALCGHSGGAKLAMLMGAADARVSLVVYSGAVAPFAPAHPVTLLGFAGNGDMNYVDLVRFERSLGKVPYPHYQVEWNGRHEFPSAAVFKDAFVLQAKGSLADAAAKRPRISEANISEELAYKDRLMQALGTQDLDWWQHEIAALNAKRSNPMYERLLGSISLACYSYANAALQQNNLEAAQYILTIYKLADPDNEACAKFTAELSQRMQR